jgi:hypothetical protein
VGGPRVAALPASTNPVSTKCTARNPPTAQGALNRANPRATTAQTPAAKSSSPPTRANPAQSSTPRRDQVAEHRGIEVGGRKVAEATREKYFPVFSSRLSFYVFCILSFCK